MQRYIFLFLMFGMLILPLNLAKASSVEYNSDELLTDRIFSAYDNDISLKIPAGEYSFVKAYIFKKSATNLPDGLSLASQVYDYYIESPEVGDESIFEFTLGYQSSSLKSKNIYLWNYQEKIWQLQLSSINSDNQTVSAKISGRKGKVLVLEANDLESSEAEVNFYNQFWVKLPKTASADKITTQIASFTSLVYPQEKLRASNIYQFDIKSEDKLDLFEPIELSISYQPNNNIRKVIYYWDNNQQNWIALPSWTNYYDGTVSAYTHLPFSRVALFEEPGQFEGEASWYAWKGGNFAASRDYPKGTKIEVTNITKTSNNFGKSVMVTVNDYGPELWTGRIIDLDKVAYSKIGYLSGGVMAVRIEVVDN